MDFSVNNEENSSDEAYSALDQAGLRAVFVPLGTIAALVGLISTALFWRQRLAYPIKGRLPMMVVASNVAGIVYILAITLHISLLDTYPCILHYSQRVVMEMAIFSIYTVRILALQFKFLLTAELAAEDSDSRSASRRKLFESNSRSLHKNRDSTAPPLRLGTDSNISNTSSSANASNPIAIPASNRAADDPDDIMTSSLLEEESVTSILENELKRTKDERKKMRKQKKRLKKRPSAHDSTSSAGSTEAMIRAMPPRTLQASNEISEASAQSFTSLDKRASTSVLTASATSSKRGSASRRSQIVIRVRGASPRGSAVLGVLPFMSFPGAVTPEAPMGFYRRHNYLISPLILATSCVVLCMVWVLPAAVLLVVGYGPPVDHTEVQCKSYTLDMYVSVVICLLVVGVVALAFLFKEVVEGLHIKDELKISAVAGTVLFCGWLLGTWLPDASPSFPYQHFFAILVVLSLILSSALYPYILSIQPLPTVLENFDDVDFRTLEGVLAHPKGREAFKTQLCKEFSLENLIFIEHVDAYRKQLTLHYNALPQASKRGSGYAPLRDDLNESPTALSPVGSPVPSSRGASPVPPGIRSPLSRSARPSVRQTTRQERSGTVYSNFQELERASWSKATFLFKKFIHAGSDFEVNIPAAIRAPLERAFLPRMRGRRRSLSNNAISSFDQEIDTLKLNLLSRPLMGDQKESSELSYTQTQTEAERMEHLLSIFDAAYRNIFDLMNRDSFGRFQLTREYVDFLQEAGKAARRRRAFSGLSKPVK